MYTARRYFERFVGKFLTFDVDELKQALEDLYLSFAEETHNIAQIRGYVTHKDIMSVIKEQNRKWNALRRVFIREIGFTILPRNYFINRF